jgi:hypothetical protein
MELSLVVPKVAAPSTMSFLLFSLQKSLMLFKSGIMESGQTTTTVS